MEAERELAEVLAARLPDEFSRRIFAATWKASQDEESPLRLTFFSVGIREMVGHLLHLWAPDKGVEACSWFKREHDTITRRQRAKYAVQGGLSDEFLAAAGLDLGALYGSLSRQMDALSKYVHVREATVPKDRDEAERHIDETLAFLVQLFEAVDECKGKVVTAVEAAIHEETVMAVITESFDDLDVLSSSHSVETVYVDEIKVTGIDHQAVQFHIAGSIGVEFYWGRGEDAAQVDKGFPMTATMWSWVDDLERFEDVEVLVDGSEWLASFGPDDEP